MVCQCCSRQFVYAHSRIDSLVISDPLNPPDNAPRQTDSQREKTKVIYKEITNANETMGDAARAVKTRFDAKPNKSKPLVQV
jgi:hypothetical protein